MHAERSEGEQSTAESWPWFTHPSDLPGTEAIKAMFESRARIHRVWLLVGGFLLAGLGCHGAGNRARRHDGWARVR